MSEHYSRKGILAAAIGVFVAATVICYCFMSQLSSDEKDDNSFYIAQNPNADRDSVPYPGGFNPSSLLGSALIAMSISALFYWLAMDAVHISQLRRSAEAKRQGAKVES